MKTMARNVLLILTLLGASAAHGIPLMDVTVSDANSKLAFKGATKANGTFATGDLRPGQYVVQFNAKRAAVKGDQFMLILNAGKKPLISNAVAGEKFAAGGVAVKMEVKNAMKISGQIESARGLARDNVKVINGRRYFFVRGETGSNLGGRWVEEGAGAAHTVRMELDDVRKIQDRAGEGSMIGNMHREALELPGHH